MKRSLLLISLVLTLFTNNIYAAAYGISTPSDCRDKINELTNAEKISKEKPFCEDFYTNDKIIIEDGPLKGQITKILSLSPNDRVNVLINILGSLKEIQIPKNIIKKI